MVRSIERVSQRKTYEISGAKHPMGWVSASDKKKSGTGKTEDRTRKKHKKKEKKKEDISKTRKSAKASEAEGHGADTLITTGQGASGKRPLEKDRLKHEVE